MKLDQNKCYTKIEEFNEIYNFIANNIFGMVYMSTYLI